MRASRRITANPTVTMGAAEATQLAHMARRVAGSGYQSVAMYLVSV